MVRKTLAGGVVLGAVLAGTAHARDIEVTDARRIPVRLAVGRLLIVPVTVNDSGPYPFLLDTGATRSLVDEVLADRLRMPRAGSVTHETATSSGSASLVQGTLALGRVRRTGALIRTRLDSLSDLDPRPLGVVGQDLLRLGNWWLDYRDAFLLEDADGFVGAADLGERLPLYWHDDRPAIDALLPDQGRLRLVLDSAASSPVLFRSPLTGIRVAGARSAVLTTLDGPTSVPLASLGPLRAGRASIPRVDAAVLGETPSHREEDGLLPTGLFQGLYFDNRAGSVILNPRRSVLSVRR
jgi:hypothetical protein